VEDFSLRGVFDCCREDFRDLWHFCEHRNIFSRRFRQKFSIVRAARIGYPVSLVLDDELVQMGILPAHNALQDSVELGESDVASHLDAPPDWRLRVAERHLDLVDLDGF